MRSGGSGGSGASLNSLTAFEQEWRADVMRAIDESSRAHQQTAVILERLSNRFDEHDRRIEALEAQPAVHRQQLTLDYRMWSLIISIVAFIVATLHPSITLH